MKHDAKVQPTTIAYLAIGALIAWNAATDADRVHASDSYSGQLGFMAEVIGEAETVERAYALMEAADDYPHGVWDYEVTEDYGSWLATVMLGERDFPSEARRNEYLALHIARMQGSTAANYRDLVREARSPVPPPSAERDRSEVTVTVKRDDRADPADYGLIFRAADTGAVLEHVEGIEPDRVSSVIGAHLTDLMARTIPGPR